MSAVNKKTLINFISVTIVSFILILFGLKVVAGSMLSIQTAFFLLGFCSMIGIISSIFFRLRSKAGWYMFNAGILIGLIEMYRTFFRNQNGWEDLAALASFFAWILIGLCAGLVIQIALFFYSKLKTGKKEL